MTIIASVAPFFWRHHDLDVVIFILDQLLEASVNDIVNMYTRRDHIIEAFEPA